MKKCFSMSFHIWSVEMYLNYAEHGVNFSFGVLTPVSLPEIGHPSCKKGQEYLHYYPNKTLKSFPSGPFSTAVAFLCATPHLWPQQLGRSPTSAAVWIVLCCWGKISISLTMLGLKSTLSLAGVCIRSSPEFSSDLNYSMCSWEV